MENNKIISTIVFNCLIRKGVIIMKKILCMIIVAVLLQIMGLSVVSAKTEVITILNDVTNISKIAEESVAETIKIDNAYDDFIASLDKESNSKSIIKAIDVLKKAIDKVNKTINTKKGIIEKAAKLFNINKHKNNALIQDKVKKINAAWLSYEMDINMILKRVEILAEELKTTTDKARIKEIKNELHSYAGQVKQKSKELKKTIDLVIKSTTTDIVIIEKKVYPNLVASIRFRDQYDKISDYYYALYEKVSGLEIGPPISLYYEQNFELGHDTEICIPISRPIDDCTVTVNGKTFTIKSRVLEGGTYLATVNEGHFETIAGVWAEIEQYAIDNHYNITVPSWEIYIREDLVDLSKQVTEIRLRIADK